MMGYETESQIQLKVQESVCMIYDVRCRVRGLCRVRGDMRMMTGMNPGMHWQEMKRRRQVQYYSTSVRARGTYVTYTSMLKLAL